MSPKFSTSLLCPRCLVVLLLLAFFCISASASNSVSCSSVLKDGNSFEQFMNACLRDTSSPSYLGYKFGQQIRSWMNEGSYAVTIIILLVTITLFSFEEDADLVVQAKANFIRYNLVMVLIQIGMAVSLSTWLEIAIQQSRPCLCSINGKEENVLPTSFGMPPTAVILSTIVALHVAEKINIFVGMTFIVFSFCEVILIEDAYQMAFETGWASLGQSLTGFAVGLFLFYYQTRTPMLLRLMDIVINLVAGAFAFFFAGRAAGDISINTSFLVRFFMGYVWVIYGICVFFLYFDFKLHRSLWRVSQSSIDIEPFKSYTPVSDFRKASQSITPQRKGETAIFCVLTTLLFLSLWALRIYAPLLNLSDSERASSTFFPGM